jgi:hypothetical protein
MLNFTLVNIRLKQIERESGALGPIYMLLLSVAFLLIEYFFYKAYLEIGYSIGILCSICLILLSIHSSRKDSRFIWHKLQNPQQSIFTEYWIFTLPIILPALVTLHFWIAGIHFLVCLGLSFWKIRPKTLKIYFPYLHRIIPVSYFEWLSGMRLVWLPFILVYLLIWAFCWVRALPIVGLWILTFMISNFYNEGEPRNLLQLKMGDNAAGFLNKKIATHSLLVLFIFVPPLTVNAFFHPDIWIFYPIFMLMYLLVLAFMITSKYSIYKPASLLKGNAVWQTMGLLGAVIPFLAPLPLLLTIRNYFRAIANLEKYKQ